MKNLKAFSRIDTALPSEFRTKPNTPPPPSSSSRRLPQPGAMLLPALALLALLSLLSLSTPAHAQGFVFTDTLIHVREGATEEFQVKLSQQPSADVTVSLSAIGELQIDARPQQSGLQNTQIFTPSNWDTYQRVRVRGERDSDSIDDSAAILLTASGGGYGGVSASLHVTILDDDLLTIISTGSAEMIEGHTTSSISFRLSSEPTADVTVTLGWLDAHHADPHVAIDTDPQTAGNQNTATFTYLNWNITRTATLTPINDVDALYGIGELYIQLPNGAYQSRSFSVIDDDIEMAVSPASLTVTEGETGRFKVRMSNPPSNVNNWTTLTLASSNTDVTFSPNQLRFDQSNWSGYQTVTVTAGQDSDAVDDTAIISMSDSYDLLDASVTVSVTDDDGAASRLILSSAGLALDEGASATFKVHLSSQPQGDRTVSLSSTNSDVTFTPATLSFYRDTWDTAQTVTLSAAQDDDILDEDATVNLTGAYIIAKSLAVSVTDDDDPAVGLTLSSASLTLNEGASTTFTVRLAAQPRSARSVSLSSTESTVTLTPGTLNFSTSTWDTAQTVTVSAAQDNDATDHSATINLTGKRIIAASATVSVADDDDSAIGLTLSAASLTVGEGASTTFTVRFAAQPGNDRVVSLASTNTDVTFVPETLSFSSSNWSTTQTVTLSAAQDDDTADDTATLNLTGDKITAGSVSVAVTDDDLAGSVGLTLSVVQELTVGEGSAASFTVRLAAAVTSSRTVSLASSNPDVKLHNYSGASATQLSINFTPQNWSTTQTVRVLPGLDDDGIDDIAIISLSGEGILQGSLKVTVIDKDTPAELVLSPTSLALNEGASATFTVRLAAQPRGGDRIVSLASTNSDVTFTPATLSFFRDTWSADQTVTVSAAQDADGLDETATINLTGNQLIAGAVKVAVTDDDAAFRLALSATSLKLGESSSATFTVRLTGQPDRDQTVNLASTNSDVTFTPATLSFYRDTWSTDQTVTVSTAQDDDAVDDSATINLTGADLNSVAVSVAVLEAIKVNRSKNYIVVKEGSSVASFYIVLETQPAFDRTIDITTSYTGLKVSTGGGSPSGSLSLTFTSANWNTRQIVTVSADQDADSADRDESIYFARGPGLVNKTGVNWRLRVQILDDDMGLVLSDTSLSVGEGSSGTFTVKLASQPGLSRTVELASTNPDVTFSPATLTFSGDDWNTAQTVTVTAGQDDDDGDDSATINLTGDGFAPGSVNVSVADDDGTSGLNLSALWPEGGRVAAGRVAVELVDADRLANDKLTVLVPGALMPDGDDGMFGALQFSDGVVSVAFGDSDVHYVQLGRPEDQPLRLSRDRHVNNLGIDHRRRQPATSV